jgi:hypothetical protein
LTLKRCLKRLSASSDETRLNQGVRHANAAWRFTAIDPNLPVVAMQSLAEQVAGNFRPAASIAR